MDAVRDSGGQQRVPTAWPWVNAVRTRLRPPRDPGFAALRRAARAALVASSAFAVAQFTLHDAQFTTFVVFGCFALLVLGDFGGRRRPRAAAYVGVTLVGALLVTLGTLAAPVPWVAALAMFLVGFAVQFAGVFGSYAAAAQTALQLSFVLAASIAAPSTALGPRLAGWCIAGLLATLAGTFLWPRFERTSLRWEAALACRALAALLVAERHGVAAPDLATRRSEAQAAVAAVRQSYAATPKRPAGPERRDRAFAELLADLEHILDLSTGLLAPLLTADHPCLAAGRALAATMAQTLEASADLLTGGGPPDLWALQEARLAHRKALDRWAEQALRDGADATAILDALHADDAVRILSYLTLAAGSNAVLVTGGRVDGRLHLPAETPRRAGAIGLVTRVAATVRAHLTPSSAVLHGSLRVGLGLALAVLLSRLLRLDHGFWVVLATLSVLRTTALATGRTTVQAIAGTIGGFVLSALFMATLGREPIVLWLSLPCAVFLAAYASSTIGFVAGQVAFTVTVVILFNLIAPSGWQLGLVRVEDVAIGAAISVAVGLLLWPRGARGEFRQTLAEQFAAVAAFLGGAFDHALQHGIPDDEPRVRGRLVRAHARAGEAFDRLLRERGAHTVDPQVAAALVATGAHALVAGDLISSMAVKGYQASGDATDLADLHAQAHRLVGTFERLAALLRTMRPIATKSEEAETIGTGAAETLLRQDVLRIMGDWRTNPGGGRAAITAVTLAEWIQLLGQLAARLDQPVAVTIEAARVPWWR